MSEQAPLNDPTNRIVCVFDKRSQADAAELDLVEYGVADEEIQIWQGDSDADNVDTSAKWFADTDVEIEKFQRELRAGKTVLSTPILDHQSQEDLPGILHRHDAQRITRFGPWVTETMK